MLELYYHEMSRLILLKIIWKIWNYRSIILPAYQGQRPIWIVLQANPSHILSWRSHQELSCSNQCLQHHSQCLLQALSPMAPQSRMEVFNNNIPQTKLTTPWVIKVRDSQWNWHKIKLHNLVLTMVILFFLLGVSAKHFIDEDSTTVSQNETTGSAT